VGVDDPALVGVLGEAELAELRAALDHPERWRPEVLAGLFEPRKGRGPHRVPVEEADALELGRSATADGRLPYLTLRVLRGERQIVWDHSFRGWPQERELEAVVVPADDAAVVAHFGAEGLAAVEWLEGQGLPHG
jgi:hypothetical protein